MDPIFFQKASSAEKAPLPCTAPHPTAQQLTDAQLVALAREGDLDAADRLFSRHWQSLLRYARELTRDCHLADDLCQAACLKAFLQLSELRDAHAFTPWVLGFILHGLHDHKRKCEKMKIVGTANPENDTYTLETLCTESDHTGAGDFLRLLTLLTNRNEALRGHMRLTADCMLHFFAEYHEFPSIRVIARATASKSSNIQREHQQIIIAWRHVLAAVGLTLS
jgi:DNA-directed RNA polymerase specialized sigma24 family protein